MKITKILIANRGEVAIRIARAAAELNISTVTVYSADDAGSSHLRAADQACVLERKGPAAYLDMEAIIAIAQKTGCDAIHPGYGFLSENAKFAGYCAESGLCFIGPRPELLEVFGDKILTRSLAKRCGIPLLPATPGACSLEEARDFFISLGKDAAVMVKAVMGGGGRGIRPVYNLDGLEEAYERCQSEALTSFGCKDVYVEQLIRKPRHIEVQIAGDGSQVIHLGERDCTIQRRNQKIIETAPSSAISADLREKIAAAALSMARETRYQSLGTMEFLVDVSGEEAFFAFMEANPRLQVEHTVTEEITGIDLVRTQIEIASGKSLADLGLNEYKFQPKGYAMQLRINMETIDSNGTANPSAGKLSIYEIPCGPGIRVDGYGYSGYTSNPSFDSLLAKLIVSSRSPSYNDLIAKACRALNEFRIEGMETNIQFLLNLLRRPELAENSIHTRYIDENAELLAQHLIAQPDSSDHNNSSAQTSENVLHAPEGTIPVRTPILGRIVGISAGAGDLVACQQTIAVIEAMKMEYEIKADRSGCVRQVLVELDDIVAAGDILFYLEETEVSNTSAMIEETVDLDYIRPDLSEVRERHAFGLDSQRPQAVASRRKKNQRTARENVEFLCDTGSFIEYGALAIAAQRGRRPVDDLIRRTPADGLVAGIGSVNSALFGDEPARCMVMAYDYTVLAGTQGYFNHKKMDRMLKVAHEQSMPLILFAEGGGGRPGDTDANAVAVAGLDLTTFSQFAGLSGKAPLIGIVSGPCFAGNAALLGCCDVIIATANSNIGMGGPVMIEGGGLGTFRPEEIGPIDVQTRNGVVDIAVADEVEAVAAARKYLSYFQGTLPRWEAADQRRLRQAIPENRLRVYDIRSLIATLADVDSVLELRPNFGPGMITALIRIEGRPLGLIANDPRQISGAIEAEGADKAARLMQICNTFGLPILSLCDTPGFMVGPEVETRAQVRHVCRMFVIGSHLTVPYFTVVLRKGYGLGAMAMAKGGFHDSFFTAAWPTGEFGGMGLEGAVKNGFKKELESIENLKEREKLYKKLVAQMYEMGKAINMASYLEIDSVIDPAETRNWIMRGLKSAPARLNKDEGHSYIDAW